MSHWPDSGCPPPPPRASHKHVGDEADRTESRRLPGSCTHGCFLERDTRTCTITHTHTFLWHVHFHNIDSPYCSQTADRDNACSSTSSLICWISKRKRKSDATPETITFQRLLKRPPPSFSHLIAPKARRHHAHLLETFLRRKCWRVLPGICQPQSLCGSFGSIQGDFCRRVGVCSMLPIDPRTDRTAASSLDCLALHTRYLWLLAEEGNKTKLCQPSTTCQWYIAGTGVIHPDRTGAKQSGLSASFLLVKNKICPSDMSDKAGVQGG